MSATPPSTLNPQSSTPWSPWPLSITAFFTIAIIGFVAFIWFCSRHPDDLVAEDYYEQELRYQGRIDRMQNAQTDAPGAAITYDLQTQSILIALPPSSAGNATGLVQLYRPSSVNQDRQFTLQADAAGLHRIDAANLSPGLWKVRVSWTVGKQGYFIDRKLVIGRAARYGGQVTPQFLEEPPRRGRRDEALSAKAPYLTEALRGQASSGT